MLHAFVICLYLAVLTVLALYGFHRAQLLYLYWKHREAAPKPATKWTELPRVTHLAALCRACDAPIDLVDVDVTDLPMSTRAYAYAFATWLALSDGVISQREECTLHVLAFVLGLPVPERTAIQSTIEQICERGSASLREGFRYVDYARVVAPGIERMLRAQQRTPIPGIPVPFRP